MEIKNNSFYDDTLYYFKKVENTLPIQWFTVAIKDGQDHYAPWNSGKFDYHCVGDHRPSPFWDWSRLSRNERKQFRSLWIREYQGKVLTVKMFYDYKEAKKMNTASTSIQGQRADLVILDDVCSKPVDWDLCNYIMPKSNAFYFGDCKPATTPWPTPADSNFYTTKEQGNNPMRSYNDTFAPTAVAGATIINSQSDESKQRDFLMDEFKNATNWSDKTNSRLRKMFNIGAPTIPVTSAELIAAFKNGDFKVDQKKLDLNTKFHKDDNDDDDRYDEDDNYVGSQYYGITFTGLPVADHKGFETAHAEYETFKNNVRRKIIVGTPAEGLEALISLETWTPSNAPVTVH